MGRKTVKYFQQCKDVRVTCEPPGYRADVEYDIVSTKGWGSGYIFSNLKYSTEEKKNADWFYTDTHEKRQENKARAKQRKDKKSANRKQNSSWQINVDTSPLPTL